MEKYIRKHNHSCKICGKSCYKRPGDLAKGRVYCSNKCYTSTIIKIRKCAVCNNILPSGKNKLTCNRKCANAQKTGLKYKKLGRPIKDKVASLIAIRSRFILEFGEKCAKCGYCKYPILEVHHKIEKSKGGTDEISNLELICPLCHTEEHYLRRLKK